MDSHLSSVKSVDRLASSLVLISENAHKKKCGEIDTYAIRTTGAEGGACTVFACVRACTDKKNCARLRFTVLFVLVDVGTRNENETMQSVSSTATF